MVGVVVFGPREEVDAETGQDVLHGPGEGVAVIAGVYVLVRGSVGGVVCICMCIGQRGGREGCCMVGQAGRKACAHAPAVDLGGEEEAVDDEEHGREEVPAAQDHARGQGHHVLCLCVFDVVCGVIVLFERSDRRVVWTRQS